MAPAQHPEPAVRGTGSGRSRLIATEEHFVHPGIAQATAAANAALSPHFGDAFDPERGFGASPTRDQLTDLGDQRLTDMDANGIDVQVLSALSVQLLPADVAVELARASNDQLAATVAQHPDRFAGFSAVPTTAGGRAAAAELERSVSELGFVGSMIYGRTGTAFLDDPEFEPVLETSTRLRAPIYLHPTPPPRGISDLSYGGLDPIVSARMETAAWGRHQETGVHFLHLVLSGVFDRYPDLQVMLGHWGEMVPFFLERLDETLPQQMTRLEKPVSQYLHDNVHITPSGMWSAAQLRYCIDVLGADRIIFSVDYPFIANTRARAFLDSADLSSEDREKIAHGNAERCSDCDEGIHRHKEHTMPTKARRRGTDLEDAVFQATLDELSEHGMAGLTFERIAARADAGKASLYRRWSGPDQLVLAALTRAEERASSSEHPGGTRLEPVGDLRTELVTFLGDLADGLATPLGRALTPLMLERERRPELWGQIVELLVTPRQRLITEALERAVARGTIPPSAVTLTRASTGPGLVLATHLTTGRVSQGQIISIVDEVVIPALGAANGD